MPRLRSRSLVENGVRLRTVNGRITVGDRYLMKNGNIATVEAVRWFIFGKTHIMSYTNEHGNKDVFLVNPWGIHTNKSPFNLVRKEE